MLMMREYLSLRKLSAGAMSINDMWEITQIDKFFLKKVKNIIDFSQRLRDEKLDKELLLEAKKMGFADIEIANLQQQGWEEVHIHRLRQDKGVIPTYKLVDTCAAEFDAVTPYFYSCYEEENEATHDPNAKKVLVIGSGPIRIGQGVEFDYCSVALCLGSAGGWY